MGTGMDPQKQAKHVRFAGSVPEILNLLKSKPLVGIAANRSAYCRARPQACCIYWRPSDAFDAQERQQGFLETVPDGLKVTYYSGDFSFECGYTNAQKILSSSPCPTVIVASNDLSALGAMRALLENGVRIPDEIAVTGFDGTRSAHFSTPSLTTVNVPIGQLAANAVELLVSRLSKEFPCENPCKTDPVHIHQFRPFN